MKDEELKKENESERDGELELPALCVTYFMNSAHCRVSLHEL